MGKIKLRVNDVAVKQLESAIWMYAYDYDEVSVHTIAGAALDIYTDRLKLSNYKSEIQKHIKEDKFKEFLNLWKRPYNFFKHGSYKNKPIESIDYDPESVEILIYLASEANLLGDENYRLNCATVYRAYYLFKHPEVLHPAYRSVIEQKARELKLDTNELTTKETLRIMLDNFGRHFVNGKTSPYSPPKS